VDNAVKLKGAKMRRIGVYYRYLRLIFFLLRKSIFRLFVILGILTVFSFFMGYFNKILQSNEEIYLSPNFLLPALIIGFTVLIFGLK
jgi:peptidoglycan/LPS O-acetylase OafA/YrhL